MHGLDQIPQWLADTWAQRTKIGMRDEDLRIASMMAGTYQLRILDPLYRIMRKFSKLECSDPGDKLYGLLGIMDDSASAAVQPDYTRGVSYAYYQALKLGLQELYLEYGAVEFGRHENADGAYLGYYCDMRDAFGMEDGESLSILRQVLRELRFETGVQDALFEVQWQQQFVWRDVAISVIPDLKKLVEYAEEEYLFKYCKRRGRMVKSL